MRSPASAARSRRWSASSNGSGSKVISMTLPLGGRTDTTPILPARMLAGGGTAPTSRRRPRVDPLQVCSQSPTALKTVASAGRFSETASSPCGSGAGCRTVDHGADRIRLRIGFAGTPLGAWSGGTMVASGPGVCPESLAGRMGGHVWGARVANECGMVMVGGAERTPQRHGLVLRTVISRLHSPRGGSRRPANTGSQVCHAR